MMSYVDSDFQADDDYMRFTLGYVFILNGVFMIYISVKQSCMEAQYVATSE